MMANQVNQVSFTPYQGEQQSIDRRREMAKILQQQSLQPMDNQMAGGWVVKNHPLQGIAKLAQAGVSAYTNKKADEQQQALQSRYQDDYRKMLATALVKMKSDPEGALGDLSSHPQGQSLMPLAMQEIQRRNMIAAMRGQGQPQDGPWAAGYNQGPPTQGGQGVGGPAGGIPMEAWMQADPSGAKYMSQLAEQNQALGGVQYDQNGKAFVVNKAGQPQYLEGITARDKVEMVNAGDRQVPINPYQQNQPIPIGISANDQVQNQQRERGLEIQQQGADLADARALDEGIALRPRISVPRQQRAIPKPERPPLNLPVDGPAPRPQGVSPPIPKANLSPKQQRELAGKRAEERPKALMGVQSARVKANNVIAKVDEALNAVGIRTAGVGGTILGKVPGTDAYDLGATIDTIKANLGFKELADMRAASPTGGALGSVTELELKLLEAAVSSLQQGQSPEQLRKRLGEIKTHYNNWLKAIEQDFEGKYGELPMATQIEEMDETPKRRQSDKNTVDFNSLK